MPLGPFDEYLAHQTSDTFDHVATSDRNFYDRYYFNMHSSSDELFVITGLGQYPNLGVTDAFITVSDRRPSSTPSARHASSAATARHVGRTALGRGARRPPEGCASGASRTSGASSADLTFTGTVAALEEPRTFIRRYGRVHPGRHPVRAGRHVGGHDHRGGPHLRRHARPLEGGARPLVGRPPGRRARAPGHQGARQRRTATGSGTTGSRCSSTTTC